MKLPDLVCPARPFAAVAMALVPLVGGGVLAQQPSDPPPLTTRLPLAFVENRGQWDSPARFVARHGPLTVHLAGAEWTLDLHPSAESTEACAVRLTFEGAREDARANGERSLSGRHSFFRGADPEKWQSDVPSWASILYPAMYPGVDVRVRSQGQDLEYDLLLAPGGELRRIVVRCDGIDDIAIDADGTLVLETALGPIRQDPPKTWEVTEDGERRVVACHYRRIDDARYGFRVPERDDRRALVIDPGLVWSTYLGGGSGDEQAFSVIADPSGDSILAGATTSVDFPTTTGAYQTSLKGSADAFVTRISAAGQLVWSTYLGGLSGEELAWGIAQEKTSGHFVVVGVTTSNDFPTTAGAYDTTSNGGTTPTDAFVSRLSSDGQSLLYSTYLGGDQDEWARSVALDKDGNLIIAGGTDSSNFPTTPGAYDTTYNGNGDVFVASLRLNGNGAQDLLWSTYLGGAGRDGGQYQRSNLQGMKNVSLAVEPSGITTVAGQTESANFPVTLGAFQTSYGGQGDFFVARLAAGGGALVASTFVGGSDREGQPFVALNRRGEPIVGGGTWSANFSTTTGAFSQTRNPLHDACLFRLNRALTKLEYATFIGGPPASSFDVLDAIHVDSAGTVTAVGRADAGFPTTAGAFDETFSGVPADAVVVRMRTDNNGQRDLQYASYLGGTGGEVAWGVVWDEISTATVVGFSTSVDFPTKNAFQPSHAGAVTDAFVTRIELLPTGVEVFGASTPGCSGPLAIGVNSMPQVDNANFALTCTDAPPLGSGLCLLGATRLQSPFKFLGVDIWLDPLGWLTAPSAASDDLGYAEVGIPIPNNQAIKGLQLFGQFFWPSPCRAQGLSASNAVDFTIQQ